MFAFICIGCPCTEGQHDFKPALLGGRPSCGQCGIADVDVRDRCKFSAGQTLNVGTASVP